MDWLSGMKSALAYIESNLDGDIHYETAAAYVYCSANNFQKVFSALCGVPLSEYVRKRRLALAAYTLQNSSDRIIDIALRYGYDSPTAFSRAFTAMHGLSPREARKQGTPLKAYPPLSFHISIKGAVTMDYKIVQVKPFRAVGVKITTHDVEGHNNQELPAFWDECREAGHLKTLRELNRTRQPDTIAGLLGICSAIKPGTDAEFDYYISTPTTAPCPDGFEELELREATYAVFEVSGVLPESIQALCVMIYSEWLPTSGYRLDDAYDFEAYPFDDGFDNDVRTSVWVPVIPE